MPPGRLTLAVLLLLSSAAAEADAIEATPAPEALSFSEAAAPAQAKVKPAAKPASSSVDAPPVLPLFAGALALLGWRLGRRRTP